MKALVVYFSVTGNTQFVAQKIAEELGADLCEVKDKTYQKGASLFLRGGLASLRKKTSEIEVSKSADEYDFLIVGSPVWTGKVAPAIRTFLGKNNFSNKQLACFVTLGGRKPQKTLDDFKQILSPKVIVGEFAATKPLDTKEETQQKVAVWCSQIQQALK